jgi:hypothetical protein
MASLTLVAYYYIIQYYLDLQRTRMAPQLYSRRMPFFWKL